MLGGIPIGEAFFLTFRSIWLVNIVCFPHYAAGGLLCDILSNVYSELGDHGGIGSNNHEFGKIGDSAEIFDNYDPETLLATVNQQANDKHAWIGTHCWPGLLDPAQLNQIIVVTTATQRSKLYRWIRAYYHYYEKSEPWQTVSGMDRLDKERETAKNYIKPFLPVAGKNVINIEFAEIVDETPQFCNLIANYSASAHMERWKKLNTFLYHSDLWNSAPVKRFYEAELEVNLNQHYIYT
jgi:hypothetical protein